jgi:hypothetical protein
MPQRLKHALVRMPLIGPLSRKTAALLRRVSFPGSRRYWETRYARGGTSGPGSFGDLAVFKAEVLNAFVRDHDVRSVIEFGCGDGAQLSLADYPAYVGLDVSPTAIRLCSERFKQDATKRFFLYDPERFVEGDAAFKADLALSLDVIYHLVEDRILALHLRHLFSAAGTFVIIYSTDEEEPSPTPHIRHRRFSPWVAAHLPGWRLRARIPNRCPFDGDERTGSRADFFIYEKA